MGVAREHLSLLPEPREPVHGMGRSSPNRDRCGAERPEVQELPQDLSQKLQHYGRPGLQHLPGRLWDFQGPRAEDVDSLLGSAQLIRSRAFLLSPIQAPSSDRPAREVDQSPTLLCYLSAKLP
jgi:hypothetical protein